MSFADDASAAIVAAVTVRSSSAMAPPDKALNRRIDSSRSHHACALPRADFISFLTHDQKFMRHADFQLPARAFPLRACALDYFFEQKSKVARAEQIDRAKFIERRRRAQSVAIKIAKSENDLSAFTVVGGADADGSA